MLHLLKKPEEGNNLKTKINQKCQKIEVNGSLTTNELRKQQLTRLVGTAQMGSWGREHT